MSWVELQVRGLREEACDVLAVELCTPERTALPFAWQAGARRIAGTAWPLRV